MCETAFKTDSETEDIPPHSIPTNGYERLGKAYAYYDYGTEEQMNREEPTNINVHESVKIQNVEILIAVSDGSLDRISGKEAYAWIITIPAKSVWIEK